MVGWWESVKGAVKNAYCDVSDFATWYASEVADLLDETKIDDLGEAQRDLFVYWNQLACGKSPDSILPPVFEPPFQGGQCEGRQYVIRYRVQYTDQILDLETPVLIGKISSFVGVVKENGCFEATAVHAGGVYQSGNQRCGFGGEIIEINIFRINSSGFVVPELPSESCGNPSGGITPTREPFTDTRDITYTDEFGVEQTATAVQFTYGLPFVEPDGTISVPYEVCYDNFCFKGKTNFGDELVVKPEPPNQDALPPLQTVGDPIGDGTETPDPELDGEPLPEAEKGKKPILGVFIRSQKTGIKRRATEIFLGEYAPAILAPNIGFVRFRVYVGDESGWLADIPIKSVDAYVPVPDKLEAVEVKVEWQQGWKGKYLINRGKHCCQECEDAD